MKRYYLLPLAAIAAMIYSCTPEEPADNRNQGGPIFSATEFVLSPIDSLVEFYVRSESELQYTEPDNDVTIVREKDNNVTTYTVNIGPNLTGNADGSGSEERKFTVKFSDENGVDIREINITQEAVVMNSNPADSEAFSWDFNDTSSRAIDYDANFKFDWELNSGGEFNVAYSDGEHKFDIRPKNQNHSDTERVDTLRIVPNTDNAEFRKRYSREYTFSQAHHVFEVSVEKLEFDANDPQTQTVTVTCSEDWSVTDKNSKDKLLIISDKDADAGTFNVALDLENGDFSKDSEATIVVKAACGKEIKIAVTIKAKTQE